MAKIDKSLSVTVVFISDGDDTVNGQAKLATEMLKLRGAEGLYKRYGSNNQYRTMFQFSKYFFLLEKIKNPLLKI